MKWLCEALHRKRLELWPSDWILHSDIVPVHKALSVKQFLARKSIIEMERSPFSPHLTPLQE